jgi:glucose/arabinose dehydrogenase
MRAEKNEDMKINRSISKYALFAAAFAGVCVSHPAMAQAQRSPTPSPVDGVVRAETLARGLDHPWALAFLPDGRVLVTERPGRLRIADMKGKMSEPVVGVPKVFAHGQGGLLDVAVDPRFSENQLIYLSYAEPGDNGSASTAVARARLAGEKLEDVKVIYSQKPKVEGPNHFGSRIVLARDGTLFITQGERYSYRDQAQNLSSGLGKIMRINPDGTVPRDNPFINRPDAQPQIWSYGHRNVQAAALHPQTGRLWTVEHGARGGDELNHPEAGKNYGWPVITYGIDYNGAPIGEGQAKPGMEQPVYYWDPVIAPSGAVFYTGDKYPGWNGSLLVGSLTPGLLVRLVIRDDKVVREERYAGDLRHRIRDVQQGPDGYLYAVTDEGDGLLLRILPARER